MTTQDQIEWRRDQVIKLASKGLSLTDISKVLQVDVSTISRDVKFLREQAKENIKKHLTEILPHEFEKAVRALEEIQREGWLIASSSEDKRIKLQALALVKDAAVQKIDLLTHTDTIDNAIQFVKNAQRKTKEKEEDDSGTTKEEDTEQQYNSTF